MKKTISRLITGLGLAVIFSSYVNQTQTMISIRKHTSDYLPITDLIPDANKDIHTILTDTQRLCNMNVQNIHQLQGRNR